MGSGAAGVGRDCVVYGGVQGEARHLAVEAVDGLCLSRIRGIDSAKPGWKCVGVVSEFSAAIVQQYLGNRTKMGNWVVKMPFLVGLKRDQMWCAVAVPAGSEASQGDYAEAV